MHARPLLLSLVSLLALGSRIALAQDAAWAPAPGQATDIAVGGEGSVWAIGAEPAGSPDKQILRATPEGWTVVPGAAARVAVGPMGRAFVVNAAGEIYRWEETWKRIPGTAVEVAMSPDGTLHAVGKKGDIFRMEGGNWEKVPGGEGLQRAGGARSLAIGPDRALWVITGDGSLWRRAALNANWRTWQVQAKDVAVASDGTVFVVGTEPAPGGFGVLRLVGDSFVPEPGVAGVRIAAGSRGIAYVVQEAGSLLVRAGAAAPAAVAQTQPGPRQQQERVQPPRGESAGATPVKPVTPSPAPVGTAIPAPVPGTPTPPGPSSPVPAPAGEVGSGPVPAPTASPSAPPAPAPEAAPPSPPPQVLSAGTWTMGGTNPTAPPALPAPAEVPKAPWSLPPLAWPPAAPANESMRWLPFSGNATDLAIGADGSVWFLGADKAPGGFRIYRRLSSGAWESVPGAAVRIAVDPKGVPWVVNDTKTIFRWDGKNWVPVQGAALDIGIGADGTVWVVGSDGAAYRWTGDAWKSVGGSAASIAVGPDGRPWTVDKDGNVKAYVGEKWQGLPGSAAIDVAVDASGALYVLGGSRVPGGYAVLRWNGTEWTPEETGTGIRIAAGPKGGVLLAKDATSAWAMQRRSPEGRSVARPGAAPAESAPAPPVAAPAPPVIQPINTTMGFDPNKPAVPTAPTSGSGVILQNSGTATMDPTKQTTIASTNTGAIVQGSSGVVATSAGTQIAVTGRYETLIVPGEMVCSDEGDPNFAPCGSMPAIDLGAFTPKAPHECPEGSFYDAYFGGSCWSCGDWRRTDKPVDTDEACAGNVYTKATRVKNVAWPHECDEGTFWDVFDGGACWSCGAGWARSAEHIDGAWGCFREDQKPATMEKNLGCSGQTEWSIGKPKPFPDLALGKCYACPTIDVYTGDIVITQRSLAAADTQEACRVQFRWKPALVKPLRIDSSEAPGTLPGAGELMAELLQESRLMNDYFLQEADEEAIPPLDRAKFMEARWAAVAESPNQDPAMFALLYGRVALTLSIPPESRTAAETRLLDAFLSQVQARRVAVPQDAMDMYRAWKRSVDEASRRRVTRTERMLSYGSVPPDFEVAVQAVAALGNVGLGSVAFTASVVKYFKNMKPPSSGASTRTYQVVEMGRKATDLGVRNQFGDSMKALVKAIRQGKWTKDLVYVKEATDGTRVFNSIDQAIGIVDDVAKGAKTAASSSDDIARAVQVGASAADDAAKGAKTFAGFARESAMVASGGVRVGRGVQAGAAIMRQVISGLKGAILGATTAAMATTVILTVAGIFLDIAIDQVVEIALAEPQLQGALDAARTPVTLEQILAGPDGTVQLAFFWAAMLDDPNGKPDVGLAAIAGRSWETAKAAGYGLPPSAAAPAPAPDPNVISIPGISSPTPARVTAVDAATGTIKAKLIGSLQTIVIRTTDPAVLAQAIVGKQVWIDEAARRASLDGKQACCSFTFETTRTLRE